MPSLARCSPAPSTRPPSRAIWVPVSFHDMPFDDYRALGFPGADDMGNMYHWRRVGRGAQPAATRHTG